MTETLYAASPGYLKILRSEFDERCRRNPRYSLRAYAKFLDLDPSALSRILAQKQDMAPKTCLKVLRKLGLSGPAQRIFVFSALAHRGRKEYQSISKKLH